MLLTRRPAGRLIFGYCTRLLIICVSSLNIFPKTVFSEKGCNTHGAKCVARATPTRPARPAVAMAPRRKTEVLPLLNPEKESSIPRTPGGSSLRAAGYTCGAVFWVVALGVGAALGFFLSHRVGWGAEHARAGPLDSRAAAEGHREWDANHTRALRSFVSRPKGPQTEAICAVPPSLSNAGLVLPKCVTANNLLDELLDQVVLPFWLGPDGLGVDCDAGGFANLGLTPDTEGAGESWKLGERFLMPHARTAAAFAKLHASGAFAEAKDGGDAKDEMPWYYVNGESHPTCLSNGGALALARHALRFATESMRDEENGGYYWSVVASEELGGKFVPARGEKRLDALAAVLMAASEIALAEERGSDAEADAAKTADDAFALMMDRSKHRDDDARGGYWPEVLDEQWTLVAGVGVRGNPRTLAAHLLAMEALGVYVDSLVKRGADEARVARAAAALAADVRTLADKAVLTTEADDEEADDANEVASPPEARASVDEEGRARSVTGDRAGVEGDRAREGETGAEADLSSLAALASGAGAYSRDVSAAVARAAANLGVRVGANGGSAPKRGSSRDGDGATETDDAREASAGTPRLAAAPRFAVAREFYGKDWSPVSALTTSPGPDDVDAVTGVGLFDVQYGRNLELTWSMLEAARAVERAAATIGAASPFADAVRTPRLSAAALASVNAYAWRFGTREGGVVRGAGGLWRGVRDFDGDAVDDYSKEEHDRERGEWWAEFESAAAWLHEWELLGRSAARRRFAESLATLYGYFVDWKVERRVGKSEPVFLSAGLRSVISDEQTRAKQPSSEPLASKRSPFKDPFRAVRALAEIRNVLRRGVDPVNAH